MFIIKTISNLLCTIMISECVNSSTLIAKHEERKKYIIPVENSPVLAKALQT
jgi:hypothetical protein